MDKKQKIFLITSLLGTFGVLMSLTLLKRNYENSIVVTGLTVSIMFVVIGSTVFLTSYIKMIRYFKRRYEVLSNTVMTFVFQFVLAHIFYAGFFLMVLWKENQLLTVLGGVWWALALLVWYTFVGFSSRILSKNGTRYSSCNAIGLEEEMLEIVAVKWFLLSSWCTVKYNNKNGETKTCRFFPKDAFSILFMQKPKQVIQLEESVVTKN